MYSKIMIAVDLQHDSRMNKAIEEAADLARAWDAKVCFVAITGQVPNRVAPSPEKFEVELNLFAREHADRLGIEVESHVIRSVDVIVELEDKLGEAVEKTGADLVVMASHLPGVADRLHLVSSRAAAFVRKSPVSVFVVRTGQA